MKFRDYRNPVHVAAKGGESARWVVLVFCEELNDWITAGEFPYDDRAINAHVRKEAARIMAGRCATYEVPLRPVAWVKEGVNGQHEVSLSSLLPEGWENFMAQIGFYNGIKMIDESSVASTNLEFNREKIAREAQDLADECGCDIEAWAHDDEGERSSHTCITAKPAK